MQERLLSPFKTAIIAFFAVMVMALPVHAGSYQPYSEAGFQKKIASGAPVMVHTHESWCVTCRLQERTLKTLLTEPEYQGITVYMMSVNSDPKLAAKLGVTRRSTIVAYRNGQEQGRLQNVNRENDIRPFLDRIRW